MSATVEDLLGAWTLECWSLVYEDGRPPEYPLGPDARGLIMYTADGHVAATLMRAGRAAAAPASEAAMASAYSDSFAYAGRFEVRDGPSFMPSRSQRTRRWSVSGARGISNSTANA
jgi:hypothetical protein